METRMVRVRKIRTLSLARALMVISFILGLVISVGTSYKTLSSGLSGIGSFAFIVILITLGYSILGFVAGFLAAFLYNLTLKLHGGIKIETENA